MGLVEIEGIEDMLGNKMTLKRVVYNAMFEDIIEGRYGTNDVITENALAEKYNVSKAPIREALIELCKDKVLQSIPRLGYRVPAITLKEIIDILDFRVDLEQANLRKAFNKITPENLEYLGQEVFNAGAKYSHEVVPNWLINQQFHLELCKLSGNDYTYTVLRDALMQSSRFASQYFQMSWKEDTESKGVYHAAVIEALKQKDLQTAEEMLKQDILAVKLRIQHSLQ